MYEIISNQMGFKWKVNCLASRIIDLIFINCIPHMFSAARTFHDRVFCAERPSLILATFLCTIAYFSHAHQSTPSVPLMALILGTPMTLTCICSHSNQYCFDSNAFVVARRWRYWELQEYSYLFICSSAENGFELNVNWLLVVHCQLKSFNCLQTEAILVNLEPPILSICSCFLFFVSLSFHVLFYLAFIYDSISFCIENTNPMSETNIYNLVWRRSNEKENIIKWNYKHTISNISNVSITSCSL